MTDDSSLVDLLIQWEEHLEMGVVVCPEELCRRRPELMGEFKAQVEALKSLSRFLELQSATPAAPTVARETTVPPRDGEAASRCRVGKPMSLRLPWQARLT